MKSATLGLALSLMLGLAGCATEVDLRGNLPDPEAVGKIKVGETTQDDVLILLGTPSTQFNYGMESWQYISMRTESVAFFDPDVIERQTLDIVFDDKGVVDHIALYGKDDGKAIAFVSRETPTPGTEMSILQQLMGNIGRFSKPAAGR